MTQKPECKAAMQVSTKGKARPAIVDSPQAPAAGKPPQGSALDDPRQAYVWGDWIGSQLRASTPLRLQLTGAVIDMAFWNARLAAHFGALALAPWQTLSALTKAAGARDNPIKVGHNSLAANSISLAGGPVGNSSFLSNTQREDLQEINDIAFAGAYATGAVGQYLRRINVGVLDFR